MEDRPKVGVAVLVMKDGKVLMGKRLGPNGGGHWHAPGGHLEFGENWKDCAIREVWEEVGIEIKNIRFATATNDVFESPSRHYVTLIIVCDFASGNVQNLEPDKCEGWDWFWWDELPSPLFLTEYNLKSSGFDPSFFSGRKL